MEKSLAAQFADHLAFTHFGKGDVLVLVGSSTAGKTSIIKELLRRDPTRDEKGLDVNYKHMILAETTFPWDLCDQHICASAVATNRVEKVSHATEEMGQHHDYDPADGIPFGIPILYGNPDENSVKKEFEQLILN